MKLPAPLILLLVLSILLAVLTGCSARHTTSQAPAGPVDKNGTVYLDFDTAAGAQWPQYNRTTVEIGQDADWILEASYIEFGAGGGVPDPIAYLDKKGRPQFYQPAPKIAAAQNIYFVGKPNQSRGFGKFLGVINNGIAGWTASKGFEAATAQNASNNQLRGLQDTNATTQAIESQRLKIGEELATKVPAEEAAGALGGVLSR